MKTSGQIVKIANGIYAEAVEGLNNLKEVKADAVASIVTKSVEDGIAVVKDIIASVETIVKAPRIDGVGLPEFLSRLSYSEDSLDKVTITIRSKLKAAVKYSKTDDIVVDENIIDTIGKFYIDSLYELYYITVAQENVDALNEKIETIITENEIPYSFKFVIEPDNDVIVVSIDNKEVVFNASVSKAQSIADLAIFKSGDEYNDLVCAEATEKLVDSLKAVQTTTQLIKGGVGLIKDIIGVSTKKRANKLIRGSYHRQAKYLDKVKSGIGYYNETVKINGEEVEVFALVEKAENGELSVVLNPFDVKTLFNVDFDVLKAVKKELA